VRGRFRLASQVADARGHPWVAKEAVVQHAHKLDIGSQTAMPPVDSPAWDKEAPWPRSLRIIFMIGAAAACWAAVAVVGYWLVH
jgi:hypothetical protein